ncbi:PREDICTED: uncharacterized protein LOC107117036 [Gekko japonicus]|uniref:Uncharacterized protein LOC107117036 n=1 Tax=Gekko japonicus TaxID=146911 RepID=A0ABM1KLG7_GEKJA|nr:PREDICTED: uncharacterized protein LOC107117036 [Gekko japonicus]
MFRGLDEGAGVFSSLLLCAVCLSSAMETCQIHRGAAAGFLLQALAPLLESAAPFAAPLGLGWVSESLDSAWISTAVGLSLLAFAFHWLSGDHCTANILLGGVLLVAASSGYLREEGKAMAAHSVTMVASVTILIVSVFTGNAYGIAGSLLAGTAGVLAGTELQRLLILRKRDVLCCLMAAANLTWRWALQVQHQELEQGSVGLLAEMSD